jgi:hypothetical protein
MVKILVALLLNRVKITITIFEEQELMLGAFCCSLADLASRRFSV